MYSIPGDVTAAATHNLGPTFTNPIAAGADPWVVRRDGYYYWCLSEEDLGVTVYRSKSLTTLGEKFVVWRAATRGPYSAQVWAPELHWLDGRWYIYVAASDGTNATHRMIVLESTDDDPTQPFHFKSELYTGDDFTGKTQNRWAIDGTILEYQGRRYMLWSGWADDRDQQWLYVAPMANAWSLSGPRVRVCSNNDFAWEHVAESRYERGLNEGPQVLQHQGRVFVVFSCSGSWETTYKLGLLELRGDDPLDPRCWRKFDQPVFESTATTFGVGHCSFTQSPDGSEDWVIFHAKVSRRAGWNRVIQAQPFGWTAVGLPVFGKPVDAKVALNRPSGEPGVGLVPAWRTARSLVSNVQVKRIADNASGERLSAT